MRVVKILCGTALLFVWGGPMQVKAQANQPDQALFNAIHDDNPEQVQDALRNGANIDEAKDGYGDTPLTYAAIADRADIVKLLLDNHANIEAKNRFGRTPLICAAGAGKADIVKLLLVNHANLEARDNDGDTPLIWAAASGEADIYTLLLKSGANEAARTKAGLTAIDVAASYFRCDFVLVLEHGAQSKTLECLAGLIEKYEKTNPDFVDEMAIRTAAAMNPRPDISEQARESYVKANVTYRSAQGDDDIRAAIALYNDALMKAPWFGDAWYNLSLAQEKLGDYAGAAISMKTMAPLEAGGPNERRDLDRIYALQAQAESAADRSRKQHELEMAANQLRKAVGGYTMYKFFLIRKQDGSNCSFDELAYPHDPCFVYASDQQGYADHDGSPIGAQVVVDTIGDQVVLSMGAQRFCMPVNQVGMAMVGVDHQSLFPLVHGVTDCGSPAGAVWDFTFFPRAFDPAGKNAQGVNGTVSIEVTKCSEAVCRHDDRADIATYWLKP